MHSKTTLDNLILYFYNETLLTENVLIQKEIDSDEETAFAFREIIAASEMLDELMERPSVNCLEHIMTYSRQEGNGTWPMIGADICH